MFKVAGLETNRDFALFLSGETSEAICKIKGISFDSRTQTLKINYLFLFVVKNLMEMITLKTH